MALLWGCDVFVSVGVVSDGGCGVSIPSGVPPVLDPPLTGLGFDPDDVPAACPHFDVVEVAAAEFGRDCVLVAGHVSPCVLVSGSVFNVVEGV